MMYHLQQETVWKILMKFQWNSATSLAFPWYNPLQRNSGHFQVLISVSVDILAEIVVQNTWQSNSKIISYNTQYIYDYDTF